MSPTLLRFWNLRVVIHTRDHRPAHIHVIGAEAEVKFDLNTWETLSVYGFSESAVRKIRNYLRQYTSELLEAWNEIHGSEKE